MKLRPVAEKSSLAFGNAIDIGLNNLLETRDFEESLYKFEEAWEKYRGKPILYSKADLDEHLVEDDPGNSWLSLRRKGVILIEEFNTQVMPRIKRVIAVQVNREVRSDAGDDLVVKCDFVAEWEDGSIVLFDNKTSSVAYKEDSVKTSPQLAIYFEQLKNEYGLDKAGYVVIPKQLRKKKLPAVEIKIIIDDISQEMLNSTLAQYDEVLGQIKAAQFPQNKASCIGKYGKCPYFDYCKSGNKKGLKE